MVQKQESFTLSEETKTLIVGTDKGNARVNEIIEALGIDEAVLSAPSVVINPLGKIPAKSVIFLNNADLKDIEKKDKVFDGVKGLKEDALVLLDSFDGELAELLGEGITKALYVFDEFKREKGSKVTLSYEGNTADAFKKGTLIGEAVNFTRTLVNRPYNKLNAKKLGEIAKELETYDNVTVNILGKKDIEKLKMGAYLGVNIGSTDEPQLIHVTYKGDPSSEALTTLVGKGVMYDTGGYSLKGVQSMPTMKMDMGGAASVLGALKASASLQLKANIGVVIAATDNRIGDDAIVPDDILTAADGTTIEIISTDAEGRLTLADALWYAQKEGATRIIDLATLTGAVVGALGNNITGAFTNNTEFYQNFEQTVKDAGEKVWRLPIDPAHHKALESPFADIKNSGGRLAGSSVAAAFLQKFVSDDIPLIHLDIAGTAFEKDKGGTGVMVKSLTKFFE